MDNRFMKAAIEVAKAGLESGKGGPFGAVVVCKGEIIAAASNEVLSTNDPTAHAEINAIRRACEKLGTFQLADCELYTTCEPCPMCMGAIYWARPSKVYFASTREDAAAAGFDDSLIYQEITVPYDQRRIPFIRVQETDAGQLFPLWNDSPLKKSY